MFGVAGLIAVPPAAPPTPGAPIPVHSVSTTSQKLVFPVPSVTVTEVIGAAEMHQAMNAQ